MRVRTILTALVPGALAVAALAAPAVARVTAPAIPARSASCTWTSIPVAQIAGKSPSIRDVAATGPDDAWAVGETTAHAPVIEHWDGASWTVVQDGSAFPSATLYSVIAVSPDLAYAFGGYDEGQRQVLAEVYQDGTWSTMPSPRKAAVSIGVAASLDESGNPWIGENGYFLDRWTGTRWQAVTEPFANGTIYDLVAFKRTNLWAATQSGGQPDTLMHFDGTNWTDTGSPFAADQLGIWLFGVSPNSMWAVADNVATGEAARYQSGTWVGVPVQMPTGGEQLNAVAADGSQVWTVGRTGAGAGGPLAEKFAGGQFVDRSKGLTGNGALTQVTVVPGAVFAIGLNQADECS